MKKNMIKKFTAIALSVAMAATLSPVAVMAEDNLTPTGQDYRISEELSELMESAADTDRFEVIIWLNSSPEMEAAAMAIDAFDVRSGEDVIELESVGEPTITNEEFAKLKAAATRRDISSTDIETDEAVPYNMEDEIQIKPFSASELNVMAREAEAASSVLRELRSDLIETTTAYNENVLKTELKEITNAVNSKTLPCILATMTKEEIQNVSVKESVHYVGYFPDDKLENTGVTYASAASTIGATNVKSTYGLTGKGVKVGMIERTYPNQGTFIKVTNKDDIPDTDDSAPIHPNIVLQCIKTTAPDSTVYGTTACQRIATFNALKTLAEKGVSVINMSLAPNSKGSYNEYSKVLDYFVWFYRIPLVTTVGNKTDGNTNIVTANALAYNALIVGGYDSGRNTFSDSCYRYDRNVGERYTPDVMAPGLINDAKGSSFAAPLVTGSLAQMYQGWTKMNERSYLVKALSLASAYYQVSGDDTNGGELVEGNIAFSEKQGAGRFHAKFFAEMLKAGRSISWIFKGKSSATKTINVTTSDNVLRIACAWEVPTDEITSGYGTRPAEPGLVADFDITLIDPDGNEVASSMGVWSNTELIVYDVASNKVYGDYTVKVEAVNFPQGEEIRCALAWY